MHPNSFLAKRGKSVATIIAILFVVQISEIHIADAKSTSLAFQRNGRIKRAKIALSTRPATSISPMLSYFGMERSRLLPRQTIPLMIISLQHLQPPMLIQKPT